MRIWIRLGHIRKELRRRPRATSHWKTNKISMKIRATHLHEIRPHHRVHRFFVVVGVDDRIARRRYGSGRSVEGGGSSGATPPPCRLHVAFDRIRCAALTAAAELRRNEA